MSASNVGHKLFFDNWFTTLDLLIYLKKRGILSCGIVRANRLQGCPLLSNEELKERGRGSIDYKSDLNSGVCVAKWLDNNSEYVALNFAGVEPVGKVKRWSDAEKCKKEIDCPLIVLQYNKGMGGVDLADMLIALYRIPCKTR